MDEKPSEPDASNLHPPESQLRHAEETTVTQTEAPPATAPPPQIIPLPQALQGVGVSAAELDAWVDAAKQKLGNVVDLRRKRKEPSEKKERKPRAQRKGHQKQQQQPSSSQPVVSHHVGNAGGGLAGYRKCHQRTRNESTMLLDVDDYGYGDFLEQKTEVWTRVKATAHAQKSSKQSSKTAAPDPDFIPLGPTIDTSSLSPEQCEALDLAMKGSSFFFTGPGGTGKSYLLRVIVAKLLQKFSYQGVHVTASTGVAACNIGGVTLHSWAGCGLAELPAEKLAQAMLHDSRRLRTRQRWQLTNVLIIDEVSMVAGDFFEKLDAIARIVRNNQAPFGGMQVILAGDFLQLPPVKERLWCFETKAWSETIKETVQLTRVFRQSDAEFVKLLNELRFGQVSYETRSKLNACLNRAIPADGKIRPTKLLPLKAMVEQENDGEYAKLSGDEHIYEARDWVHPDHPDLVHVMQRDMQAAQRLKLRVGTQVMLLKNLDVEDRLFNGARGVVVGFQQDRVMNDGKQVHAGAVYPVVEWAAGKTTLVTSADFTIESSGTILAYRNQLPLSQAWALSIHKAQGSTLDCAELSLAESFEYGQVYVALSRARSLQGVYLRTLDLKRIKAHPKALAFYHALESTVPTKALISTAHTSVTQHHHHQQYKQQQQQQQQQQPPAAVPLSAPSFSLPPAPLIPTNVPPPSLPSLAPPPPLQLPRAVSDPPPSSILPPPSLPPRSISHPVVDLHSGQKRPAEVIVIEDSPKRPAPDRSSNGSSSNSPYFNEPQAAPWPPPGFVPAAAGNVVLVHNVRPTFRREVFETTTAACAAPQGRMQPRVLFEEKSQYAIGGSENVRVLDLTDARLDAEFTEAHYMSHAVALPQRPA